MTAKIKLYCLEYIYQWMHINCDKDYVTKEFVTKLSI